MTWTKLANDDPRIWAADQVVEGKLMSVPEATTLGGFISIQPEKGSLIVKYCPSKLYGPLAAIPIGSKVRIFCHGKKKTRGRMASWQFDVYRGSDD